MLRVVTRDGCRHGRVAISRDDKRRGGGREYGVLVLTCFVYQHKIRLKYAGNGS